jgi:signal transduction histidine kinase
MKTKLLAQNGGPRNAYPWDEKLPSPIVRLDERLEQRLAERTIEVQKKADQLQTLACELAQVERRERGRLAAILHDNLQQLLVGVRLQISFVKPALLPMEQRNALSMADKIIRQAIADSRSLTMDLSPPILHGAGLGVALKWLAGRMAELHGFTVCLSIDSRAEPQAGSLSVLLFETVRELLFNSCKHSGCTRAQVTITGKRNYWLHVVVEDAGKGFDPEAVSASMASGEKVGLFRIQQRLENVGARMALTSEPGTGMRCEVLAHIDWRACIGNRRPEGKMDSDVWRENKTRDAITVTAGQDRKSCMKPIPAFSLSSTGVC